MDADRIKLLTEKKELLTEAYDLTLRFATEFCTDEIGADKFIDAYSSLYERRDVIFNKIKSIQALSAPSKAAPYGEAELVKGNDALINEIIALDKKTSAFGEKVMSGIKEGLKGLKVSKNISEAYSSAYHFPSGMYVNRKD